MIALTQRMLALAVKTDLGIGGVDYDHLYHTVSRHRDRPVAQGMRADRHDRDRVQVELRMRYTGLFFVDLVANHTANGCTANCAYSTTTSEYCATDCTYTGAQRCTFAA